MSLTARQTLIILIGSHGSRIYWRAKSQRYTKIFCSRILIGNSISRRQLLHCDARPWRGDSVGTRNEIVFLE
jgi:hypothetical protein